VFSVDTKTDSTPANPPRSPVLGPAAAPPQPSPYKPGPAAANGVSVIGRDLTILGDKITIVSQNKLQVDGDVRGDVYGKQVVITDGGSVEGMVCAEKIEVHGAVRGSIRAVTVVLNASAKVDADIMHQTLGIAEGAHFEGRVQRSSDTSQLMPVLDPEEISSGRNGSGAKGFM
jgi:cytoskeletal protein CcmA (bactofilin family)